MRDMIFYHSDDYGVSILQSQSIKDCYEKGVLNSVSIMPNSPKSQKAFEMIQDEVENGKIRCVVHLNFIEGKSLASKECIPDLVDEDGNLKCSFVSVLKMNYHKNRTVYKKQFIAEITEQIKVVSEWTNSKKIQVDSHQHFHMIPIVWEALMEVIKTEGYELQYIRISLDPISILMTTPSVWKYLRPVNLIKWGLLSFLCPSKKQRRMTKADIPVFFGLFYTCEMKWEVVSRLLPKYKAYAKKREKSLELMFHPGAVYDKAELLDADNQELVEFYASKNREDEKNTLLTL